MVKQKKKQDKQQIPHVYHVRSFKMSDIDDIMLNTLLLQKQIKNPEYSRDDFLSDLIREKFDKKLDQLTKKERKILKRVLNEQITRNNMVMGRLKTPKAVRYYESEIYYLERVLRKL